MSTALMNTLRESLILERARALYTVVTVATEEDAIEIIKLALRVERDEGIKAGHKQAEQHATDIDNYRHAIISASR